MLRLAALLLLPACASSQRLAENLTDEREIPLGAEYDRRLASDPDQTGVAISPPLPHVLGPAELRVVNRSGDVVRCELYEVEDGFCEPLPRQDVADLLTLEPREVWRVEVECAEVDVVCLPEDADDRTLPLRVWSWFVEPPPEDDA